jgi:hypothetical protein
VKSRSLALSSCSSKWRRRPLGRYANAPRTLRKMNLKIIHGSSFHPLKTRALRALPPYGSSLQ